MPTALPSTAASSHCARYSAALSSRGSKVTAVSTFRVLAGGNRRCGFLVARIAPVETSTTSHALAATTGAAAGVGSSATAGTPVPVATADAATVRVAASTRMARRMVQAGYPPLRGPPARVDASPVAAVAVPQRVDLLRAADRVEGRVRRTPLLEVDPRDLGVELDIRLLLKLECLQFTGSFKARGATNAVAMLEPHERGVVAASGGNHGAAVAWAATRAGVRAEVFVPESSPKVKRRRIEAFGGAVHLVPGPYAAARVAAATYAAERGLRDIHAYDDPAVVAGQGTLGLEILDQVRSVDRILVAVGGGGLFAGVGLACDGMALVTPAEPERCPTLSSALEAGAAVDVPVSGVAADSTGATRVGSIALVVARRLHEPCATVDDQSIIDAQAALWSACRVVAEPGGAVAVAALRSGQVRPEPDETVVVVVCGGNTKGPPRG